MQKLHFSMLINAPKHKVWHAMLDDRPYREWTKAFNEGSYYKGSWEKGSKILFLGPDPDTGEEGGMVSRITENKPYEFISIEHLSIVQNGVEDPTICLGACTGKRSTRPGLFSRSGYARRLRESCNRG